MMDTAVIEKQAMQLPEADRALLADHLLASLSRGPAAVREAWAKEAESRMAAYKSGLIEAVDGPAAMAELRSRFAR